jgi:hypothetical protein
VSFACGRCPAPLYSTPDIGHLLRCRRALSRSSALCTPR